jgi:hypothetical protein
MQLIPVFVQLFLLKLLLAEVNFHVLSQILLEAKSFFASQLFALVSVFSNMQSFMLVEVSVLRKRFRAEFTFVWFLSSVNSNVALEMVRGVETLVAALTLKGNFCY